MLCPHNNPVGKVCINFTGDKDFHILLLLADHILFIIEKTLNGSCCIRCRTILAD